MISANFVRDLAIDPTERKATDVSHAVAAVGSRDAKKAQEFIDKEIPKGAWAQQAGHYAQPPQALGSYDELCNHPEVDIVYIGTPHPAHFDNAKAALEAGKGALVEKPAVFLVPIHPLELVSRRLTSTIHSWTISRPRATAKWIQRGPTLAANKRLSPGKPVGKRGV